MVLIQAWMATGVLHAGAGGGVERGQRQTSAGSARDRIAPLPHDDTRSGACVIRADDASSSVRPYAVDTALLPAMFDTLPPFVRGEAVDAAMMLGNVCGALVYLLETSELSRSRKLVYATIAAVLGYGIAPEIIETLPWMPPMLAGALASALVVCALVAAFRQAEKLFPSLAKRIGTLARRRLGGGRGRRDDEGR